MNLFSYNSGGQKFETDKQGYIPSGGSKRESISLLFLASEVCAHALACGPASRQPPFPCHISFSDWPSFLSTETLVIVGPPPDKLKQSPHVKILNFNHICKVLFTPKSNTDRFWVRACGHLWEAIIVPTTTSI